MIHKPAETSKSPEADKPAAESKERPPGYATLNEALGLLEDVDVENLPDYKPGKNGPRAVGSEGGKRLIAEFERAEQLALVYRSSENAELVSAKVLPADKDTGRTRVLVHQRLGETDAYYVISDVSKDADVEGSDEKDLYYGYSVDELVYKALPSSRFYRSTEWAEYAPREAPGMRLLVPPADTNREEMFHRLYHDTGTSEICFTVPRKASAVVHDIGHEVGHELEVVGGRRTSTEEKKAREAASGKISSASLSAREVREGYRQMYQSERDAWAGAGWEALKQKRFPGLDEARLAISQAFRHWDEIRHTGSAGEVTRAKEALEAAQEKYREAVGGFRERYRESLGSYERDAPRWCQQVPEDAALPETRKFLRLWQDLRIWMEFEGKRMPFAHLPISEDRSYQVHFVDWGLILDYEREDGSTVRFSKGKNGQATVLIEDLQGRVTTLDSKTGLSDKEHEIVEEEWAGFVEAVRRAKREVVDRVLEKEGEGLADILEGAGIQWRPAGSGMEEAIIAGAGRGYVFKRSKDDKRLLSASFSCAHNSELNTEMIFLIEGGFPFVEMAKAKPGGGWINYVGSPSGNPDWEKVVKSADKTALAVSHLERRLLGELYVANCLDRLAELFGYPSSEVELGEYRISLASGSGFLITEEPPDKTSDRRAWKVLPFLITYNKDVLSVGKGTTVKLHRLDLDDPVTKWTTLDNVMAELDPVIEELEILAAKEGEGETAAAKQSS